MRRESTAVFQALADPPMRALIERVGPCLLKSNRLTPFQALLRSIVYQQLHGAAAAAILKRVRELYPGVAFPSPADILETPEGRLRSAGLSRAKLVAIQDLARQTLVGIVPSRRVAARLSDEELIQRLTVVRGVGPWTVEMFLIFTLGRPDIWPVMDFGVRKGFALVYGSQELPTPKGLLLEGERWRPHRSTAAWYLWRANELAWPGSKLLRAGRLKVSRP